MTSKQYKIFNKIVNNKIIAKDFLRNDFDVFSKEDIELFKLFENELQTLIFSGIFDTKIIIEPKRVHFSFTPNLLPSILSKSSLSSLVTKSTIDKLKIDKLLELFIYKIADHISFKRFNLEWEMYFFSASDNLDNFPYFSFRITFTQFTQEVIDYLILKYDQETI